MGWWLLLGVGLSPAGAAPHQAQPGFESGTAGSDPACSILCEKDQWKP